MSWPSSLTRLPMSEQQSSSPPPCLHAGFMNVAVLFHGDIVMGDPSPADADVVVGPARGEAAGAGVVIVVDGVGMDLWLAGLCNSPPRGPSMILWKVDETSMEFSEMAVMPQELLYCLFDREEDDRFASLKCVGLGNLIYVFNEEHHKCYPACVCEITPGSDGLSRCSWRRLPPLPSHVNSFHKLISFCSTISRADILQSGE